MEEFFVQHPNMKLPLQLPEVSRYGLAHATTVLPLEPRANSASVNGPIKTAGARGRVAQKWEAGSRMAVLSI